LLLARSLFPKHRKEAAMPTEVIQVGATSVRFLVEGSESNGSVAVFEVFIPANANMPAPHSHDGYEETIYGLAGTSTWTVEGNATEVGVGDAICIPRGAVHAFDNRGELDAKALAVVTPGILGPEFFREAGAVLADAGGGPPDFGRLGEVMRRHGLTSAPKPVSP
jgi:quercetin dioxygenase-like cupin family protein